MINQDLAEIVAFLSAPSEQCYAILREVSDAHSTKERYVEVWAGARLEASLEVMNQHRQFHIGVWYSGSLGCASGTHSFPP